MRKSIFPQILLLILLVKFSFAQWQPDARLTVDPSASFTSFNNSSCIATSGNSIHIVWYDARAGRRQIFYKRSTDLGNSWGADTQMTAFNAGADYGITEPAITASGQDVHMVFTRNWNTQRYLYYKHSTNGGLTWGPNTQLVTNFSLANPSIFANGQSVHIVLQNSSGTIQYILSTDDGTTWGGGAIITTNSSVSNFPSISISGGIVAIAWEDSRDLNYEIYSRISSNGGLDFGAEIRLTNNTFNSLYPSVSVSGQNINVVWQDDRDGNTEIYYKRSTDAGSSWSADTRLTFNVDSSAYPFVCSSGQFVHVAWQDHRNGNWEMYYKRSTNGGVSWEPDTRLTTDTSISEFPSLSVSGTAVNLVWTDFRDGNSEIYFKKNPNGNVLGISQISNEIPKSFSLYQNYPNPFNPSTKIKFDIPANVKRETSDVKLVIYDVIGREVSTLVNEELKAGSYEVEWNAANYPSGVYFYKLTTGEFNQTKKLALIK